MTTVIIDFDVEGFHEYPMAPAEVGFLAMRHRHIFQIKCGFQVSNDDREIEIFMQTEVVEQALKTSFGSPAEFDDMSCEHIARWILDRFGPEWVKVLEDGKGGAEVRK